MAKAIVHCRACGEPFDRNSLVENVDWVQPVKKFYYHKSCYERYQRDKNDVKSNMSDEMWFNAAWDFLTRDLKGSFVFIKVKNQWESFLKKKMTSKGIFFSLKYFYSIKKGDVSKCEGGIGIVSHIYEDSCNYWIKREVTDKGICAAIEKQILESRQCKDIVLKKNKKKKKVSAAEQLDLIMEMEDEDE